TSQTEATVPSQGPTAPHAPAPQQASAPLEPAACEPPKPQETPAPSPEAAAPPVEAQQEPPKNIEPPAEPTASAVPLDGQAAAGSGIASRIRQTDDEPRQEELPPTASGMEGIESRILDPTPVAGGMDHRSDADEPPAKEIPTAEEMPEAPRHGGPDVKPPVRQFQSGAFSVRIAGDAVEQEFDDGDDILLGAELTTDADADGGRYAVRIGPEEESPDWPDESSSPLNQLAMQEYATDAANGEAGCEEAVDVEVPGRVESVKVDEEIDEEVHRHESSDSDDPPATAKPQPAADDHGIAERIADLISQISRQRKGESAEDVAEERATEALREAPAQTADAPAEPAEPDRPTNTEQPAAAPADDGEAPRSQLDNLTHADDDDDDDEVVLEGVPAPPPPDEGENGQPIGAQDDARNRPSSEVVSIADIGEGRRRRIEAKTKKPSRRSRRSDTQRKRRSDGREVSVAEELLDNQMAGETPVDSDDGKRKGKRAKRRKHSSRSGTEPMSLARRAVMITPRPEAKQSRWRSLGIQAGIVVMALLATVLLLFLLVF
ncbi:MAG: hypothetical protein KGY81_09105, partial [Phycisphaerae bacterium]|nr:hypothetical protein [Phycisphaerae bacterium]